jgi:hypothetical protein
MTFRASMERYLGAVEEWFHRGDTERGARKGFDAAASALIRACSCANGLRMGKSGSTG